MFGLRWKDFTELLYTLAKILSEWDTKSWCELKDFLFEDNNVFDVDTFDQKKPSSIGQELIKSGINLFKEMIYSEEL